VRRRVLNSSDTVLNSLVVSHAEPHAFITLRKYPRGITLTNVTAKSELVVFRVIRIGQPTIGYYVAESLVDYFQGNGSMRGHKLAG
jgi:hypothetical protein